MARIRYRHREEESSHGALFLTVGAIAGLAVGVLVAQRFGGFAGLTSRLRDKLAATEDEEGPAYGGDAYEEEDDFEDEEEEVGALASSPGDELESRVLEAFRNDPILGSRALDIGAIGRGIIELTGWVHSDRETELAVTLARGVPGVDTIVNRVSVRGREAKLDETARKVRDGDPSLTEAQWEGQHVGTGRRRQGTSAEIDRHADPKPELEERWLNEAAAMKDSAEDIDGTAERRKLTKHMKGDRTGGSPVAPSGVPKSDHVKDPGSEETRAVLREQTGRDTRAD